MKVKMALLSRHRTFGRVVSALVLMGAFGFVACREPNPIARSDELIASGRANDAISLLREAIDASPEDDDLQFAYARALSAGGMRALAEWPLRRAMRVERWRKSAGLAIAENAMVMQNMDVAIEVLSELLEDDPDDVEVLLRRAAAHAATRTSLEATLDDVAQVRELAPDDLRAYRPEIQAYLHAAMTDEAAKAIDELGIRLEADGIDDEETHRWYCVTRALFEQESFRFEGAEARWEECLLYYPTSLEVVAESSTFFESQGNMPRSLEIIGNAVAATDLIEGLVFRAALSQRLHALGRTEEALALLKPGTEEVPPETALGYWNVLTALYETAGRLDEALAATVKMLALADELGVTTADQQLAAGDLAIRSGDLERAARIADEIGTPSFRGLLEARIAHDRGALEDAVARYEEVARLWPDNAFIRYHEARALEQLGDLDRAIELYRHATRIDATATDAQTRIALILEAEGRFVDALSVLATQTSRGPLDLESDLVFARLLGRALATGDLRAQIAEWHRRQPTAIVDGLTAFASGLRLRGEARAALSMIGSVDPRGLVESPGGPGFVREMLRAARAVGEPFAALDALIDEALAGGLRSAEWVAVDGYRAELAGDASRALDRYDAALAANQALEWVVAARARVRAADWPDESEAVASSLLEDARNDRAIDEAATVVRALAQAGHVARSRRLYVSLLDRRPYDVEAANALCSRDAEGEGGADLESRLSALSRRLRRLDRACPAADQVEPAASPAERS
jgi:tetratricopeptide (TPR) repeat protein